jgi:hypothetical protein
MTSASCKATLVAAAVSLGVNALFMATTGLPFPVFSAMLIGVS